MKRVVLVILVLAAVAVALAPANAKASVPCRDRIYNDWYADGKIATTYPVACYRDALKHVKGDALIYSSLSDDIRAALQGALAKAKGDTKVPAEIGNTGPAAKPHSENRSTSSSAPHDPAPEQQQVNTTLPTPSTIAAGTTNGGNSGVPVPLLVLGGLALLLTAVGGIGVVAKRRRL